MEMIKDELCIVSYGGGLNSTAMLIEIVKREMKVDLILFADTGGERPETYDYVKRFSDWLKTNNYPSIITVKKVRRSGEILTLEQNCLEQKMLPSLAYGFKGCSQKYKIAPQDKYVNNWVPAKNLWKDGGKVTKYIGYDADEHRRAKISDDKKYKYKYPLIDWDYGRDECIEIVNRIPNLCTPNKSACFFCPATKKQEIKDLFASHPELYARAIAMESNAELTKVKGLGRSFAWVDFIHKTDFMDIYANVTEISCDCYDG